MVVMSEQMGNLSKEMETIFKNGNSRTENYNIEIESSLNMGLRANVSWQESHGCEYIAREII